MSHRDSDKSTSRRDFLREGLRSLLNAGFGGLAGRLEAAAETMEGKPRPLSQVVGCELGCLNPLLEDKSQTIETLPVLFRDMEIRGISVHERYLSSWEPRHLETLRDHFHRNGLVVTSLMTQTPLLAGDPTAQEKLSQENILKMEAAAVLSAPVIRFKIGVSSSDREEDDTIVERAGTAIHRLLPIAQRFGVRITLENQEPIMQKPENLIALIRSTHARWVGACLDLGNGSPEKIYDYCRTVAPYAFHVHAKASEFDARGEEAHIEYGRMLTYLKMADYPGALSIEFVGEGETLEGVRKTRDLIRRYWRGI